MRRWHKQNPPGGRGTHKYTPEEFGLDDAAVRARFAEYRQRFGAG